MNARDDYHDLYLNTDILLLADFFEKVIDMCVEHFIFYVKSFSFQQISKFNTKLFTYYRIVGLYSININFVAYEILISFGIYSTPKLEKCVMLLAFT